MTAMERATRIIGCILAGGQSSRMEREKALLPFGGVPLIARVAARLAPQVERLVVSANGPPGRFAFLACPILADRAGASHGPLSGLAAALAFALEVGAEAVVTVPCDAPFVPLDLVDRLRADGSDFALARQPTGPAPLFGLWPLRLAAAVEDALGGPDRSVARFAARHGVREVLFAPNPAGVDPLANLNTPADFEAARAFERLPPAHG